MGKLAVWVTAAIGLAVLGVPSAAAATSGPVLTAPLSVGPAEQYAVTGAGFPAGLSGQIEVTPAGNYASGPAAFTTDSQGNLRVVLGCSVCSHTAGTLTLTAVSLPSRQVLATTVTTVRSVSIAVVSGPALPGGILYVRQSDTTQDGDPIFIDGVRASPAGTLLAADGTFGVSVPANIAAGPHTFTITDSNGTASASFTVQPLSLTAVGQHAANSGTFRLQLSGFRVGDTVDLGYLAGTDVRDLGIRMPVYFGGYVANSVATSSAFVDVPASSLPAGATTLVARSESSGFSATATVSVDQSLAFAGTVVASGTSLTSPNGQYVLAMQGDGNLVEYGNGRALWWTPQSLGHAGAFLVLQGDGNAVIYGRDGRPLWSTGTWGTDGNRLIVQDDGNVVVYGARGEALWYNAAPGTDRLIGAVTLLPGQFLHSPNFAYSALLQSDGNFVVYRSGVALWSTAHSSASAVSAELDLRPDGVLATFWHRPGPDSSTPPYTSTGFFMAEWGTPSAQAQWNYPGASGVVNTLVMQNDGNLVLYSAAGRPLWNSAGYPM